MEHETLLYRAVVDRLYEDAATARYRRRVREYLKRDYDDFLEVVDRAGLSADLVLARLQILLGHTR